MPDRFSGLPAPQIKKSNATINNVCNKIMPLIPQTEILKSLIPICELTATNFQELIRNIQLEFLSAGETLFRRGDTDTNTIYLINGEVSITDGEGNAKQIDHRSRLSRYPLDHHLPHHQTVTAISDIRYIRIENNFLDMLLTWDQNTSYIVQELGQGEVQNNDENDWMSKILHSRIFHNIPAANIHTMFMKMQTAPVHMGEVVMRQGESGDYYYMIKEGRCAVIRNAIETGNESLQIAELTAGQGFGEEALISESARNATVQMLTPGILAKLSKEDFNQLLKTPVLQSLSFEEANEQVRRGAIWLDIRLRSEHQNAKLAGSLNIPLFLLRLNAHKLLNNKKYIVYCDTGRRSASAAFILRERGIDCYALEGGLQNLPEGSAV